MLPRLDGRTVVVTRGKAGEDALVARLAELGASVRELPSIAFGPPEDTAPLDAALRGLARFDWIVFASATAVDRTLARAHVLGVPRASLARPRLAAVGPATAARLAREVRAPDLVPSDARGEAMAAELAPAVRGAEVFLPRPAEGRPELLAGLEAAGAKVTAVEAYRTVAAPPEVLAPLSGWLESGEVDAVAFASPSAVRAVVESLASRKVLLARALVAAIGPTTAAALRGAGVPVGAEPATHTGKALAEAIAERLGPG